MNPGIIAFIVVYCVVLCCYFFTETSGNMKLRAPNKIVLALMFFAFGTAYAVINNIPYSSLFIVALLLSMLGDVFLLYSFTKGGFFFASGNIAFIAFQISILCFFGIGIERYWWVFIIIPVLWSIYPLLSHFKPDLFKFGSFKGILFFYLSTIVGSGSFGIVVASLVPSFRLLGIGLFLFMLSDFDIVLHKFVCPKNKWVHRLNSALYFTGMLLVALNVALIA
ncbi:MAG: lysoplasmalogenase [Bacilli bacterium]|nr:lysoplasmalogenase [Bacilli bacterium]